MHNDIITVAIKTAITTSVMGNPPVQLKINYLDLIYNT